MFTCKEQFPYSRNENIPYQERKMTSATFYVNTKTPVKKFELKEHFQRTQETIPQKQRNISPSKIPFGTMYSYVLYTFFFNHR